MKSFTIKYSEIGAVLTGEKPEFPKYSTQLLNLANQNAQGTRPKIVGQMSDLIQEFKGRSAAEWERWYTEREPKAIAEATEKIYQMIKLFRVALDSIDKQLVEKWVRDLVIVKTYAGLKFQEAILRMISKEKGLPFKLSTPFEEGRGIDGYVGEAPVSVKPTTYKQKMALRESIGAKIVYYEKKDSGIYVEYDF
jgi:hypothetical protein